MSAPLMLGAAAAQLLQTCAGWVGPTLMAGLIRCESGWLANAIGDNTTRRSYHLANVDEAEAKARELLALGHNIDAGLSQVNSDNWPSMHLNARSVFDPCDNVHAGATILSRAYAGAKNHYAPGDDALLHALSAYNTGNYSAGITYANNVFACARSVQYALPKAASVQAARPAALPVRRPNGTAPVSTLPSIVLSRRVETSTLPAIRVSP